MEVLGGGWGDTHFERRSRLKRTPAPILEEGRKAVQNAQKQRGAKRQKTRGDDDF